jgi:hydrogenase assembly chaperone HypC/HupF
MCLTEPVHVLFVDGPMATVEANGRRRVVSALAVPDVQPGNWAILAAGLLVRVLEPEAAAQIATALRLATDDTGAEAPPRNDR